MSRSEKRRVTPKSITRWLLGPALVLLGTAVMPSAGATTLVSRPQATTGWTIKASPNADQLSSAINELSSVSCSGAQTCTAVGSYAAGLSSPGDSLAERWNGSSWKLEVAPLPKGATSSALDGVSCPSASACTAVGQLILSSTRRGVAFSEKWNGSTWTVESVPNPVGSNGANLRAVSCSAPSACTAVGFYDTKTGQVAMADRWNGSQWSSQVLPKAAATQLNGVACTAAKACTAVGSITTSGGTVPLALHWNGSTWATERVPLPQASTSAAFSAISCTSTQACTATGANFGPSHPLLAERWNGTTWAVETAPTPSGAGSSQQELTFNSVACSSSTSCTATGEEAPGGVSAYFLETWQSGRWQLVTAPHPGRFTSGAINSVACAGGHCAAVGAWSGGAIYIATLALDS